MNLEIFFEKIGKSRLVFIGKRPSSGKTTTSVKTAENSFL